MTKQEAIKKYFSNENVNRCVTVSQVEELAGIYKNCLHLFLKKGKYLSNKNADKVIKVIRGLNFHETTYQMEDVLGG